MSLPSKLLYDGEIGDSQIRLLEIELPTEEDDADIVPISCKLATFPLAECPDYTALSYAWHEPLATSGQINLVIQVNGIEISVQPNLAHAMRLYITAVRKGTAIDYKPTWFWIDALCINQSDTAERTLQVSIMHKIYRGARNVVVYLGPDPDCEAYSVREFFRAVLQRFWHDNGQINYEEDFLLLSLADRSLPPSGAEIWRRTIRFWDRCWFGRSWVQQEVTLAQYTEFWCGDVPFMMHELAEASRFYILSGLGWTLIPMRHSTCVPEKSFEGPCIGNTAIRYRSMRDILSGRTRWETQDQQKYANRLTGPANVDGGGNTEISMLRLFAVQLHLCFTTHASDDRDKIFSLLVLMKEVALARGLEELPLTVDYAKDAKEVYRDTTTWVIRRSSWLGILGLVRQRRTIAECQSEGMPSWVIDFSSTKPSYPALLQNKGDQSHRLSRTFDLLNDSTRPRVEGLTLDLSVQHFGTVMDVGNSHNEMVDDGCFEETAKLLLKCPEKITCRGRTRIDWWMDTLRGRHGVQLCESHSRTTFAQYLRFVIMRRIQRDARAGLLTQAREFFMHQLSVFQLSTSDETGIVPGECEWRTIFADPKKVEEVRGYDPNAFKDELETHGRRLLRLENLGVSHCPAAMLLAIGPEATQVGDEVFLVAGSMMPFVLRRATRRESSSRDISLQQAYFVGEAYVNGAGEPADRFEEDGWQRWQLI